jgi:hypothetical protein
MNNYITFGELEKRRIKILNESMRIIAKSESQENKNIFLSHSSKDEKYLSSVIDFLQEYGGQVYIDKLDKDLPNTTNHETAVKLKGKIKTTDKFILFATKNSKESKWIPWELGLADGIKDYSMIAILPSAENRDEENWAEQEYLGIYQKIVKGSVRGGHGEDWIVKNFHDNTGTYLKDWLKQNLLKGIL